MRGAFRRPPFSFTIIPGADRAQKHLLVDLLALTPLQCGGSVPSRGDPFRGDDPCPSGSLISIRA